MHSNAQEHEHELVCWPGMSMAFTCKAPRVRKADASLALQAKRKSRTAQQVHSNAPGQEDELVCWTGMSLEAGIDMQSVTGLVKQPVLLNDNSVPAKRMRSSVRFPPTPQCRRCHAALYESFLFVHTCSRL